MSVNIVCSFLLFSINQAYDTRGAFGLTRSVERLDTGRYRHHGATTINYRSYLLVQGKDLLPTEKNITETMNLTGLHQFSRKISEVNHNFGFFSLVTTNIIAGKLYQSLNYS